MHDKHISSITICKTEGNITIDFAAEELAKYLRLIVERENVVDVKQKAKYDSSLLGCLWVGLYEEMGLTCAFPLDNPQYDDAYSIHVEKGLGIIAGVNHRSVLLGVYRFLTELGCRWIRPDMSGEYIPKNNLADMQVNVDEKASYRHRGLCIEGAVSYENVSDIIAWSPKVGFNSYFIQFREAHTFFERWYSHENNPHKEPEAFTIEQARAYTRQLEQEINKRGLIYHAVGHGWTCEPLGIPGLGWGKEEYNLSDEYKSYIAEIKGKREFWNGVPINTNLCYSNQRVRRLMVDNIVQYLQENKGIDLLHVWLGDDGNNHCECEPCRTANPADFYVKMLNELDEQLNLKNLKTRIVFLIYIDLLWPPQVERFFNPERFIMMFAPSSRTYSKEFFSEAAQLELPEFKRNELIFPTGIEENLSFLKAWQQKFKGDSFDFDYHFMLDHYNDPGYYKIAELLSRDIKNLKTIGLNGFISCQTQRSFFPTGLGIYVLGQTLWNDQLCFESIAKDYFSSAFGQDGEKCRVYLAKLSELFDPVYLRGEKPQVNIDSAMQFGKIYKVIEEFRSTIEKNLRIENEYRTQSWQYLWFHAEICVHLAAIFEARALGDNEKSLELWGNLKRLVGEHEDAVQPVFDVFLFINAIDRKFVI
ncbi:DUF4838 domain-containing protein [Cohnella silvisoli]|uniref:DUF4838 domain-containing protein n=1 Tax=Cohnella silvisoli TaxID=2873699 RepID=A0ABV1KLK5_9BACL|nr:DUF4838 domain-containing protein [Cohnella silvisoli]MCD9020674.1 DUF4838 domain-containing protein [Cohnella silvisoli]